MYHRLQPQNFRTTEAPLGGSFYSFLLRPRFQYLNVGQLLEYTVSKLWALTGVRTNRVDFTLVNICSPFTKFSHGSCGPPPRGVWPAGPALILTFAVSALQQYSSLASVSRGSGHVRVHDNVTTQWSTVRGQVDFVSVAVSLQDAHAFGLQQPKSNELEYLYNLLGAATKSIIRHQTVYRTDVEGYEDLHEGLDLRVIHDLVYQMPFRNVLTRLPYHMWPFSGEVWRRAPNLIPMRLITPSVALYYFMFLRHDISLVSRCSQDVGPQLLGIVPGRRCGILKHLISSTLELAQMIKSPPAGSLSQTQMMAASVAASQLYNESLDTGQNYEGQMTAATLMLLRTLADVDTSFLFPPDAFAFSLLVQDSQQITDLQAALGLMTT